MNPLLAGILWSLAPISELRGGLPLAIAKGVPWPLAFAACAAANIVIIPLIFLFLDYLHSKLLKRALYRRTFNSFLKKIRKRKENVERAVESYGMIALMLFVAIPLPATGAWTGSIIAWLLNLHKGKSFTAIAAGVLIAGIIVTLITLSVMKVI
jgi:uncharacterized membrane protein